MAEHDSKSEAVTTEVPPLKMRRYTVSDIRDQRKYQPAPAIILKGYWMAELGFSTGQKVEVITEPGQLIIRLAEHV